VRMQGLRPLVALQTRRRAGRPHRGRPAVTQGRRAGEIALPPAVPARRSRPMLVRHATPARNLNSILRRTVNLTRVRRRGRIWGRRKGW
jgi:hypothetical protein